MYAIMLLQECSASENMWLVTKGTVTSCIGKQDNHDTANQDTETEAQAQSLQET